MQRVYISIQENSITIGIEKKQILSKDLKKVNKYLGKEYGPKTAEVVVNFLQVWNEEESNPVCAWGTDVSKRAPQKLVLGDKRQKNRVRKRRRSRRTVD